MIVIEKDLRDSTYDGRNTEAVGLLIAWPFFIQEAIRVEFESVDPQSGGSSAAAAAPDPDASQPSSEFTGAEIVVWPEPPLIDLGGLPLSVSADAEASLSRFPWPALSHVFAALRQWAKTAPVRAARIRRVSDPESADWEEVVVELRTEVDAKSASELWDSMASHIERAMRDLPPEQRQLLDRHLALHLLWGADRWNDDDAGSV